jgi:hypothetical protein
MSTSPPTRSRLDTIYKDTNALVDDSEDLCSDGEMEFLRSWIKTRKMPSVWLSIKDHKPVQANRRHPTRLIVSAHNFTQCLSKLASKSIECTFKRAGVIFQCHTLKSSLELKKHFENDNLQKDDCTIESLDIKDMYPQCKLRAVKAAVHYCTLQLDQNQCERTKKCLEILKFSMGNTIVSFLDKYYKYGVDPDPDRRGLTIGGFESAFLTNLKASYILDKLRHIWERHVRFLGTYCNDKIIVFNGQKSNEWLLNWLRIFQGEVDRLLGTSVIQFTVEVWQPGETSSSLQESEVTIKGIGTFHHASISGNKSFPYLDITVSCKGRPHFNVYKEPGELVKYLNHNSHHHRSHITAVLSGVGLWLALLTTKTADNLNKSMSDIYPDKHDALTVAGQLKPGQKMRKLGDILDNESRLGPIRLKKRSRAVNKHDTFFIVKYANLGKEWQPISQTLKKLRNAYHLKRLRSHIIYSRHNNLQEKET